MPDLLLFINRAFAKCLVLRHTIKNREGSFQPVYTVEKHIETRY